MGEERGGRAAEAAWTQPAGTKERGACSEGKQGGAKGLVQLSGGAAKLWEGGNFFPLPLCLQTLCPPAGFKEERGVPFVRSGILHLSWKGCWEAPEGESPPPKDKGLVPSGSIQSWFVDLGLYIIAFGSSSFAFICGQSV